MKRTDLLVLAAACLLAACGDNSKLCGTGTIEDDHGTCVPDGSAVICGDGTILDPVSNDRCIPSATVCGVGTVLVRGTCQDPTAGLEIDREEGAEPNGFEPDANPAGVIQLAPVGGPGFVIHGCIRPTDNASADFDVYYVTVTAPTLIKVTADGVVGLAAGFVALSASADPLLRDYERYGINLAHDMSRRQLYLPAAGTYGLALTDSRTLLGLIESGGQSLPVAGNPDGTSCYYVTIDQQTPTINPLNLTAGDTGTISEDLEFYTAPFDGGFISVSATIDAASAQPSLVLLENGALRQLNTGPATALFAGISGTDTTLLVLDYIYNYSLFPAAFAVTVDANTSAQPLPRDGSTLAATSKGQAFFDEDGVPLFGNANQFYFDVTAANQIDGIAVTFSEPVQGVVVDHDGLVAADFTGLDGTPESSTTFRTYTGLLRFAAPGRYYFFLFLPQTPVGTPFTVTSTIATQTPGTITLGTPLTAQQPNAFNSNAYTYATGTAAPWQLFNASGTNTGELLATLYDANVAFGRLDTLETELADATGTAPQIVRGNPPPLFGSFACVDDTGLPTCSMAFPEDGSGPVPRILTNGPTNLVVKITPTTPTGSRSFALDFAVREYHDFGPLAAPAIATVTTEPLDDTHVVRRFYVATTRGNMVTIAVTPNTPAMDPEIVLLTTAETDRRVIDTGGVGLGETFTFQQDTSGFTAFAIRSDVPVVAGVPQTFGVTVTIRPPAYAATTGTTAYVDACIGGTNVPLVAVNAQDAATDEGMSDPLTAPGGFAYFTQPTTTFRVSSNGWLSFVPVISTTNALFTNRNLPDSIGRVNIAAHWDDLGNAKVCTKVVGGKTVVQWTGRDQFGQGVRVAVQAILDPADDSIELVWSPDHQASGSTSTAGIQDLTGTEGLVLGFDTPQNLAGTSKKLTPQ